MRSLCASAQARCASDLSCDSDFADLAGSTATDGCIYLDSVLRPRKVSSSPVAARYGQSLSTSLRVALSDTGRWAHRGQLDGPMSDDMVIVRDGEVWSIVVDGIPRRSSGELLDAIDEADAADDVREQLVAVELAPAALRGLGELEDHGQRRDARAAAFGARGAQADGREG